VRVVTYRSERGDRAGVLTERGAHDAAAVLGAESLTVRELLASGGVEELERNVPDGEGA
jgi:hypothetical protein